MWKPFACHAFQKTIAGMFILQHDHKPFHCIRLHILYLHPYHNTNKVSMFFAWFYERKSRRTRAKHTSIITRTTLQLFFNFVASINNQDTSYLFFRWFEWFQDDIIIIFYDYDMYSPQSHIGFKTMVLWAHIKLEKPVFHIHNIQLPIG